MSGILCLKWNNHTTTFIKALDILRSKELYCDATIACHGKYYPVHRFVLTTCSEYFEEIFERTQCKHPFIIVKDVEELQLEALLNYMYKGEVNVLQERLPGLIRAAEALKIKGLAVSEDSTEETKPTKEKRKSNSSSSPLQPKSKKKPEKNSNQSKRTVESDDDIQEVDSQNSRPSKKGNNNSIANSSQVPPLGALQKSNFQNNVEQHGDENEMEDIKIEPTEICENAEDDFVTNSNENQSQTNEKEDSLFVSLLSPNDTHSLSQELMDMNDRDNEALPQCSTWNDDVSNNSDKTQDEIAGKNQWLESEGFDPLEIGSCSYLSTSEKGTNKCLRKTPQEASDKIDEQMPIDESNGNSVQSFKSSLGGKFNLSESECSKYLSEITDNSTDFTAYVKEEFSGAIEPQTLSSSECSSFVPSGNFDFPDCGGVPSSADLLLDGISDFGNSCRDLEQSGLFGQENVRVKSGKFHCVCCPFKCRDKAALRLHVMRKHTGEKPFSCAVCSYRCTTKELLKIHNRKHTGERPFPCPYCSVRMSVKSTLKRHIQLKHMQKKKEQPRKESPVSSEEPSSVLTTTTSSKHISNTITNAKPYKCTQCSYETHLKKNLDLHKMRIHTGEKPFGCSVCPYRTTTKSQLQTHMRRHTGEKPYACSFCNYRASQKHHLLRHMYIHTK